MRFRLQAFGLHVGGSASALTLILGALWVGWYRWPGWYLASVLHVVGIVVLVDLVLGPTLTLIVASPAKARAVLARDIAIIVAVQLVALGYGATTLWGGRPLYYTFSVDRLELVQRSDLRTDDVLSARRENPQLAPFWYSLPRWIWAPLPDDPHEAEKIVSAAVMGGPDIIQMPRYFRPWEQGLAQLRQHLQKLDDIPYFNRADKAALRSRMSRRGLRADQADAMVLWGGSRPMLAVFDPGTVALQALLAPP